MSDPTRSASMTDVARRAGVSQSTVSYVLSGSRRISDEVRDRVERAVRELDYAPRAAARALRGGATQTLALSIPVDDANGEGWLGLYLLQLTVAARRRGYDLLVSAEDDGTTTVFDQLMRAQRADGAILMSVTADDKRIASAERRGFPTVALGEPLTRSVPFVDYDFRRAAEMAIDHQARLGHDRVLYVGPKRSELQSGSLYVQRVIAGFRDAARRAKVDLVEFFPEAADSDAAFTELVTRSGSTALVLTRSLGIATHLKELFLFARPAATERDVLHFGTSGLGLADERGLQIVNPIGTLAGATVDSVVDLLNGRGAVSRLVAPILVED